jgi:hypothetical protein
MAAHPKLAGDRERRLLALLTIGEPLEAACRAVLVSATAVRQRARRDPAFAQRVSAARERRPAAVTPIGVTDWREIAAQFDRENPLRSTSPIDDASDPFDGEFDPLGFDPLGA